MLQFDSSIPDEVEDGATLIVLLHGRGSDKNDLMGLRRFLPPSAMVITPRAPFPGAPWGYGPGWAWYRYIERDRPEPESFGNSLDTLHSFLQELPEHLPVKHGQLVLGGFSQGGTMSLGYALSNPGEVAGILNFSGFLPDHPAVPVSSESVAGTRFFWGHGKSDPAIPFELAIIGREKLATVNADLAAHDYEIGHWIDPAELNDAVQWLESGESNR